MIRNRSALATTPGREVALDCLASGIAAADPERAVRDAVSVDDGLRIAGDRVSLTDVDRIRVLGGGKPAGAMARGLETVLAPLDRPLDGLVVSDHAVETDRIAVEVGSHPLPDAAGRDATREVLDLARAADERTLVLAVIGGGGSALLPAPAGDLTLDAVRDVTRAILDAGASVDELNAVRKHVSRIKGGGLARAAGPAPVIGLLASDVVGDDPSVIASGPTVPDPTTYADALAVLDRYGIEAPAIRAHLERGATGDLPETPDAGADTFDRVSNHVVLDARRGLDAAVDTAADRGYATGLLASGVQGEARESGRTHAAIAAEVAASGQPIAPPAVLCSGGECTVTVHGDGEGGPNAEFVLGAALDLAMRGDDMTITVAAVDTDGRDGGSGAAGGIADIETITDPDAARAALATNDAGGYLADHDGRIETGDTGTNVNDLRVIVVDR